MTCAGAILCLPASRENWRKPRNKLYGKSALRAVITGFIDEGIKQGE